MSASGGIMTEANGVMVALDHLSKYFGAEKAVDDVNLAVAQGEFVTLLGPSGCGKTTTLRMIGGLEEVTAGKIYISGEDVTDLPPSHRNTAMMFQSFALGEVLEGVAQSLPEGLRQRLSATGLSGLIGAAPSNRDLLAVMGALQELVGGSLRNRQARGVPFPEAVATLAETADGDRQRRAVELLRGLNADGVLDEVQFETVWSLLQAMARSAGNGSN